jgi:hypothetical protein
MEISDGLMLLRWPDLRFLHGDFTGGDSVWLLLGLLLAVVVISALAVDMALVIDAPHRYRSGTGRSEDVPEIEIDSPSGD